VPDANKNINGAVVVDFAGYDFSPGQTLGPFFLLKKEEKK
jgi:hypothetical protein